MYCPIVKKECLGEDCIFYDKYSGRCLIREIMLVTVNVVLGRRDMCPICGARLVRQVDGTYVCYDCKKLFEIDETGKYRVLRDFKC